MLYINQNLMLLYTWTFSCSNYALVAIVEMHILPCGGSILPSIFRWKDGSATRQYVYLFTIYSHFSSTSYYVCIK